MRPLLFVFLVSPVFGQNILTHSNFPHPNLFNALDALFPGGLTASEAAMVDYLDVANQNISDLTGLEYFKGLQYLIVRQNAIAELPHLSIFPNLIGLHCNDNQITQLPGLETLTQLRNLNCSKNPITALPDLSAFYLTHLNTSQCPISELPWLGDIETLEDIRISYMKLTQLPDLSALSALRYLDVYGNKLSQLVLSDQAENLANLFLADNFFTELPDVTNYPYLANFHFYNNLITEFPVFTINHLNLESVYGGGNLFDVDDCPAIQDALAIPGVIIQYLQQGTYKTYVQEYPLWNTNETIQYWIDAISTQPYRYQLNCP